jgi:hypothetical protein
MRPGRRPIEAFGRCLQDLGMPEPVDQDWPAVLRTPDDLNHLLASQTPTTLVNALVLDQFEELFTQAEPTQREAAFALLSGLDPFSRLRTHIIATLRSDYLPNLFAIAPLFACVKRDG